MTGLSILVADDHEMVRKGIRATLETRQSWSVCGEAMDGRQAVELALHHRPDIVVMDLAMPHLNGLEASRRIQRELPDTEILILTMHDSETLVHEILQAGIKGLLLKSDAGELVCAAVDSLCEGKPFFSAKVSDVLLRSYFDNHPREGADSAQQSMPTSREREIIQLIAEGRSTKEIAAELGISSKTAETHRTNLMRKIDAHSVSDIVRYAIRNRMIDP